MVDEIVILDSTNALNSKGLKPELGNVHNEKDKLSRSQKEYRYFLVWLFPSPNQILTTYNCKDKITII